MKKTKRLKKFKREMDTDWHILNSATELVDYATKLHGITPTPEGRKLAIANAFHELKLFVQTGKLMAGGKPA